MARWRLTAPHYLNIPGTQYRYEETDRESGEVVQHHFDVGRYLDPENPRDCRSPEGCVVCDGEGGNSRDWVYKGSPTPDMEPLDDSAKVITDKFMAQWQHPIESLPASGDYSRDLLASFEKQLADVMTKAVSPATTGVSLADFKALQEQVAQLAARNIELEANTQRRV